jgi:hypothetical protein
MTTRRKFLKQPGVIFCGCCLPGVVRAQAGGVRRLPVTVAGKRVAVGA